MRQNIINCTHHFSTWQSVMGRISPHDNLLCEDSSDSEEISPHFSTGTVCGACDKYQVWSRNSSRIKDLKWNFYVWEKGRVIPFCFPADICWTIYMTWHDTPTVLKDTPTTDSLIVPKYIPPVPKGIPMVLNLYVQYCWNTLNISQSF